MYFALCALVVTVVTPREGPFRKTRKTLLGLANLS